MSPCPHTEERLYEEKTQQKGGHLWARKKAISSIESLNSVQLFATPWIAVRQASLSITNSRSSLKLMCIESVMPSSHLILCFSSCPQSLPASGSFPVSQLFAWGGQSIGVSASTSVLPVNTQNWSPLEWTGWISLQSKGLARVFSSTTVKKHQFFSAQLSSQSNSHTHTWPLEKPCFSLTNKSRLYFPLMFYIFLFSYLSWISKMIFT